MAITFERELTMSADEFLRILPAAARAALNAAFPEAGTAEPAAPRPAANGPPYTISGRTIVIAKGERRVEIRLCEKGRRRGIYRLGTCRPMKSVTASAAPKS